MKLVIKLLLGIALGIVIGLIDIDFVTKAIVTFKSIFDQIIGYIIPLIIFFFIAAGITSLGQGSGKLVGLTVGAAYTSTIIAGLLALTVAYNVMPFIAKKGAVPGEPEEIKPFFTFEFDPLMGVLTALITAFLVGIIAASLNSPTVIKLIDEGQKIVEVAIYKIIIPFLPFYIASIFTELAAQGTVFNIVKIFGLVLILAIALHWVWLIILYTIAGTLNKRNPFSMIKNMIPAYFTAVGTMSSAATIPVTLEQTKKNKVTGSIADFAIPLLATIHLSGSTITLVSCSIAAMIVLPGMSLPAIPTMIGFIFMLGIIMIAAPGVPGGSVMAASGILGSILGFNESAIGLMIALYMAQDSFGTATNITGDGAITAIVDKLGFKNKSA
ncbi:dicarboxylate/amino acid:cation symporter [Staphylococcus massiliensis]|uniref:dicarboxylate/amino acid:cation symporter n=1 Tax=Staphylococcus massiliensis TaxID=555791 RepID=UPI001EE09868|nr:dicarboxylate/amino acid:cation symporter [Staphylococcus massiliensis]MCG3399226.1 dicarboxylate/amino acid:cation symporter [Staphylococcus massiliensis]MCG3402278.1 dicarboxylate/amino acid:cation symporter [Staphylococcus massiliensis]